MNYDAGYNDDDEWLLHCDGLVKHLHETDPDGERFRYPSNIRGALFEPSRIDLERLGVAHWHVGMFCDGCIAMLYDLGRAVK